MTEILVIAETRRGALRDVSFELVGAARDLAAAAGDARISVALVDHDPARHAPAVDLRGVDRILTVKTENEHFDAHVATEHLRRLIEVERPGVVLLAHSVDSMAFAPAVAAILCTGFASDVVDLSWDAGVVVRRGSHGGKLMAELDFAGKGTAIVMLRPGSFAAPVDGGAASAEIVPFEVEPVQPRAQHRAFRDPEATGVDITKSPFLLAIGRGVDDEGHVPRFEALAERMGATLSVSRPLVDAGWAPSALQVGQSGKTVKPKVYLALGISGAVQHLAGMRGSDTIIAINRDPAAPIFGVAHYGAVADLFEVVDALERRFDG
ncbi:MAG TPA: electron transfer flavoprotein subunit alpha/FixB family protein [Baekduia sp.]|nr:electron transfer flavoprotein subunit alpha/FixB family protein [Baekduia sp.]